MPETTRRPRRAADAALAGFIRRLPKAELHLHIEGTLEPELLLELGRRNGVDLPCSTAEECRAKYRFSDLQNFLDIYYEGVAVLVTEQDYYDLTAAYVRRVAADGARHVEVFFDPQSHVPRGVPFADVVGGITRALREGEAEYGVSWRLIMCFLRDRPAAEAMEMLELALPHRDVIAGVGLDSAELGHPPAEFAAVYEKARAAGFVAVAHAGEEGPPEYISEALDVLKVRRIDHGVAAIDDPALQRRLAERARPAHDVPAQQPRAQGDAGPLAAPAQEAPRRRADGDGELGRPGLLRRLPARQLPRGAAGAGPEPRRPGPARAQLHHRVPAGAGAQSRAARGDRPGGREADAGAVPQAPPRRPAPQPRRDRTSGDRAGRVRG